MTEPHPRDALDRTILDLARAKYSIRGIARETGRSTSVIHWRIRRMRTTIAALRNIRCTYCGALTTRSQQGTRTNICGRAECRRLRHNELARRYDHLRRQRARQRAAQAAQAA